MSKTITSALRQLIRENGGSAKNVTDIKDAIDQLDGVGGDASSAKLDEIIAAKGVGVRTKKTDEEVLNLTVPENEWTVEDNVMYTSIQSDFEPQAGTAYKVLVDGVEYTVLGEENPDLDSAQLYIEELHLQIYADDGELSLGFHSIDESPLVPADHMFVIKRTYGVNASFITPEAEVWQIDIDNDVAYVDTDRIPLVIGDEYVVTWDGVEYPVTAAEELGGTVFIGNKSIGTDAEDTGEPFAYFNPPIGDGAIGVRLSDAGVHTVTIVGDEYEYQKIDEKYLPGNEGYDVIIAHDPLEETFQYLKGSYDVIAERLFSITNGPSNEDMIRFAETKIAVITRFIDPVRFSVELAASFSFYSDDGIAVSFPNGIGLTLFSDGTIDTEAS